MSTTEFYILLQHSFGSLMHLIQAPVQFDQLLEGKTHFIDAIKNYEDLIKSKISTLVLSFFMKRNSMYMTTSRVDDYPTSMNSHGTEAMKAVQSAPYQVFGGTNCSTDRFYRYKKVSKIIAYS